MALNFPASPTNGQIYFDSSSGNRYIYDAATTKWRYAANNDPIINSSNTQILFNQDGSVGGSNGITFSANTLYANTVNVTGYIYGNGAFLTGVVSDFSPAYNTANAGFDKANTVASDLANTAISANNWANTKLSNTSGVVFGGNLTISQDLTIGNNITNVTSIILNTSTNRTPATPGELTWSDDDSTLRFNMDSPSNVIGHIGQDQFYYVKNQTGSTINKGTVVRFAGTLGSSGRLLVAPAIANNSYPSKYVVGVAAATINNGDDGFVLAQGKLRGIDTSAFSEGDILYVSSSTPGAFSNTMPTAPNNKITLAAVVKKDNNQGTIEVRLTLGSKLNEDELVEIGSPTDGDTIQYVSANGRFENRQTLASAYSTLNAAFGVANAAYGNANSVSVAANNYAGVMANSANAYASATFGTITNITAAFAAANQAGVVANNANTYADSTYVKKAGDTITGDLVVQGNVTISGNTTYANTQTLLIGDNILTLNADLPAAVAPSENAGIEINRGTQSNVALLWNEGSDKWTFTNDGTNYRLIASNTDVEAAFDKANSVTGGATISNTAPSSPTSGALWWSNTYGRLFVYYNDGDSAQWVDAAPASDVSIAFDIANSAFAKANAALANTSGVSFNGSLYFPSGNISINTTNNDHYLNIEGAQKHVRISGATARIRMNRPGNGVGTTAFDFEANNQWEWAFGTLNNASSTLIYRANTGTSFVDVLNLSNTGNVGIGTNVPAVPLHIVGAVKIANDSLMTSNTIQYDIFTARIGRPIADERLVFRCAEPNNGARFWFDTASATQDSGFSMAANGVEQMYVGTAANVATITSYLNNPIRFRVATGNSDFTTGTVNVMELTANGRVGIGTTSPRNILQVGGSAFPILEISGEGTAQFTGGYIALTANAATSNGQTSLHHVLGTGAADLNNNYFAIQQRSNNGTYIANIYQYDYSSQQHKWYTNNSQRAVLDANGRVGIGNTNPQGTLHLSSGTSGDCSLILESDSDNDNESDNSFIEFRSDGSVKGAAIKYGNYQGGNDNALILSSASSVNGGIAFRTSQTNDWTNANTRMFISALGNTGIGTTSPSALLDITTSTTNQTALRISNAGGGTSNYAELLFGVGVASPSSGYSSFIRSITNYASDFSSILTFGTSAASTGSPVERMRISNAGNVLIGKTYVSNEALGIGGGTSGISTGTSAIGLYNDVIVSSSTTGTYTGFDTFISTAASSFTINNIRHYKAGQFTIGAGSTVTNQYGFLADASLIGATNNYGFFSNIASGTGRWNFYANGTADNYFAGNVGIGTSSPSTPLNVIGEIYQYLPTGDNRIIRGFVNSTNNSYLRAENSTGVFDFTKGNGSCNLYYTGNNAFFFIADSVGERLRIDSSGNVGIGTTSPTARLHVTAATTTAASLTWGATAGQILRNENSELAFGLLNASPFPLWIQGRNTLNAARNIVLQPLGGAVGIGTTSPDRILVVSGSSATLGIYNTAAAGGNMSIDAPSANLAQIDISGSHSFRINSNSTERFRITSAGDVGIGTSSPAYKLQVNGSFAATTKSFVIDHPSKPGMKLRYGSLEGPENGVYIRGRTKTNTIDLPDYWKDLVDIDTITVQLTPIGNIKQPSVGEITENCVEVIGDNIDCFYFIQADRKDVEKLIVEFEG